MPAQSPLDKAKADRDYQLKLRDTNNTTIRIGAEECQRLTMAIKKAKEKAASRNAAPPSYPSADTSPTDETIYKLWGWTPYVYITWPGWFVLFLVVGVSPFALCGVACIFALVLVLYLHLTVRYRCPVASL